MIFILEFQFITVMLPYQLPLVFLVSLAHNQVSSTSAVPERATQQYEGKRCEAPYTGCRLFTSTFISRLFGLVSKCSLLCCCSVRYVATPKCGCTGSVVTYVHVMKTNTCSASNNVPLVRDFLINGSLSVLNTVNSTANCRKICSPICCESITDLKVCVRLLKSGVQVGFLSLVNAP